MPGAPGMRSVLRLLPSALTYPRAATLAIRTRGACTSCHDDGGGSGRGCSLRVFQHRLGYTFQDERLLEEALTHISWSSPGNERLEFLGDSVLGLVVSTQIFDSDPATREGELTMRRCAIVRNEALAEAALTLGIPRVLRTRGAGDNDPKLQPRVLAGAFEALAGAVYLDSGNCDLAVINAFAQQHLPGLVTSRPLAMGGKSARNLLQEWAAKQGPQRPQVEFLDVEEIRLPMGRRKFTVEVRVEQKRVAVGQHGTKKGAQEQAAAAALAALEIDLSR